MSILSNSLPVKEVLFGDSTAVCVNICSNCILTYILRKRLRDTIL